MATRKLRIIWEKVRVHRSETYGVFGEPGRSAEWRLYMDVTGLADRLRWESDGVKSNRDYDINREVEVEVDDTRSVKIHCWGFEYDDSSDHDELPELEVSHDFDARWSERAVRYKKSKDNSDFDYTVHYTIQEIDRRGGTLTPGHGVLFDVRYSGLWDANQQRVEASVGLTADEVNAQGSRLWGQGGRLHQLQPYVVGDQVRYNVIWRFGGGGQVWNIDCDEAHFVKTTGELWSWARPHSVIPFVVGGQVRYAVLWNEGQHAQRWHHNTDEAGFRAITGETWSWARPHQVYAYVINGQVRYSCLWNAGQQAVLWHPNCSEAEAWKLGGDNWSWGRGHQMQPFNHNGERRFSVLWQEGQHGQLWNLNCDQTVVEANTADTADWARPSQLLVPPS